MKTPLRSLVVLALWLAAAGGAGAQVVTASLAYTFTNPTPESSMEWFGRRVAALGEDRVMIGCYGNRAGAIAAGAAYLFSTTGTLITVITNPIPTDGESFALSLAVVGTDKVLIGAPSNGTGAQKAGAAYLFSTNGTLLTTFTNPTPMIFEFFGYAVAALDADNILIGAKYDGTIFNPDRGAVYLYSASGALITTVTNPNPFASHEGFGGSVSGMGTDKLLIGAPDTSVGGNSSVGAAYLFTTNGTLISTFTNPNLGESDGFGLAVASVGTGRVIIGANVSAGTGAAYLFNTNGTLLVTFNNPDPANQEYFGSTLAALGTDLLLIGARQDTPSGTLGKDQAGTAYLFNTNGTLLLTIANPSPFPFFPSTAGEHFGSGVAVLGTNKLIIGAESKNGGGFRPGAAHLFNVDFLPPPALKVEPLAGAGVRVAWPYPSTSFVLEQCGDLNSSAATNSWTLIPPPYTRGGASSNGIFYSFLSVTLSPTTNQFYRLRQP